MSFIFVENCKGLHTKLSPPPPTPPIAPESWLNKASLQTSSTSLPIQAVKARKADTHTHTHHACIRYVYFVEDSQMKFASERIRKNAVFHRIIILYTCTHRHRHSEGEKMH